MNKRPDLKGKGAALVVERLDALAVRRTQIQGSLADLEQTMDQIRREAVDESQGRGAMAKVSEVLETLPPYHRKRLIRLVLQKAVVSETELRLAFQGRPPEVEAFLRGNGKSEDAPRSETPKWLPGLMSQSPTVTDWVRVAARRDLWNAIRVAVT